MLEVFLKALIIVAGIYLGKFITNYIIYKELIKILNYDSITPYTLPKMSFEQIYSLLNIPELNIKHVTIREDYDWGGYYKYKRGISLVYTWNGGGCDIVDWLNNKNNARCLCKPIFFVPKSSRDYRKLCNHFNQEDKGCKDGCIRSAQIESLKYLTDLIHQAQDKHKATLQNCQTEMDRYLDAEFLRKRRNM